MVVEAIVLSTVLAASSQRCGVGTTTFLLDSSNSKSIVAHAWKEPSLFYSATIEDAIAKDLGILPDVHYVCVERADGNMLVWIGLDNPSKERRERVFQKQFDLIDGFPEISFDFNIIATKNRAPADFASSAKVVYSREDR